jgi:hypothetical protein
MDTASVGKKWKMEQLLATSLESEVYTLGFKAWIKGMKIIRQNLKEHLTFAYLGGKQKYIMISRKPW